VIRLILVYVAKVIDEGPSPKKYTDTDYDVFSDAATHVYNGNSPFARHTYRYTPIAAYICVLNNLIHPLAGKVVFCIFDILMGLAMWRLIESQNRENKYTWAYVAFWLYNPVTITMSTRGSNDNIITLLVFVTVYYLLQKRYIAAGLMYGFSVHFKIYPIIYSFVFFLYIDCDKHSILKGKVTLWNQLKNPAALITKNRLNFTLVSACTFLFFTGLFYMIYGYECLYESLLYHFVRKDNRHNYSVYWLMIYQTYDLGSSAILSILAFLPQWIVIITAGFALY
jgi:GPI mannosyltransferase 1 subunit M